MDKDAEQAEVERKFWDKLKVGTAIVSKSIRMFLFGLIVLFMMGLLPAVGYTVNFFSDHAKNTEFRKCWPQQKCEGYVSLPIDAKQNAALTQLYEEMGIVTNYVTWDCHVRVTNGEKDLDCRQFIRREPLELD